MAAVLPKNPFPAGVKANYRPSIVHPRPKDFGGIVLPPATPPDAHTSPPAKPVPHAPLSTAHSAEELAAAAKKTAAETTSAPVTGKPIVAAHEVEIPKEHV